MTEHTVKAHCKLQYLFCCRKTDVIIIFLKGVSSLLRDIYRQTVLHVVCLEIGIQVLIIW